MAFGELLRVGWGVAAWRGEDTLARNPEQLDDHGMCNYHLISSQLCVSVSTLSCFLVLELDPRTFLFGQLAQCQALSCYSCLGDGERF